MLKRVAVITDAISPHYMFPYWYKYYASIFGSANLHVLTYMGLSSQFFGLEMGSLQELPFRYNNRLRMEAISNRVSDLLRSYDLVLRCDVDEFLAPNPAYRTSLGEYMRDLQLPYVTARGIDLIELQDDAPLILDGRSILAQRQWGLRATALNKTVVTSIPLVWGLGFHATNTPPLFDELFLVHTKFSDIRGRIAWFTYMLTQVYDNSSEWISYSNGHEKLASIAKHFHGLERDESLCSNLFSSRDIDEDFVLSIAKKDEDLFYYGKFQTSNVLQRLRGIPLSF